MHVSDWYPTIIEGIAGLNISHFNLNYTLDGVNHWDGIKKPTNDSYFNGDEYFYFRDTIYYDHDIYNHFYHHFFDF